MNGDTLTVSEKSDAATFQVRVIPRAKRTEIVGVLGGAVKIKLAAPPVEGAANEALVKFLAEKLGVRASQVGILSGQTARLKTIRVTGLSAGEVRQRLAEMR